MIVVASIEAVETEDGGDDDEEEVGPVARRPETTGEHVEEGRVWFYLRIVEKSLNTKSNPKKPYDHPLENI